MENHLNINNIIVFLSLIINTSIIITFFVILERRLTKIETIQAKVFEAQIKALFRKFDKMDNTLRTLLERSTRHREND